MSKDNIEAFYPLSPAQQGILFHTLYAPEAGIYSEQLSCTFEGGLDTERWQRAWQQVSDRHPILRTAFVWEGVKEPVQVVQRKVTLPWQHYDWQGLSSAEQQTQLAAWLEADLQQGFALNQAPLMRFTLIRLAANTYHFVWSHHHLLLDGWSTPLLLQEVLTIYQSLAQGEAPTLPQPRPYRDYIAWIQQQNLAEAEAFWRQRLQGFVAPTSITIDPDAQERSAIAPSPGEQQTQLAAETTTALQTLARQHQLTLNTLAQGAWALLLSHYSGESDVVFGTAVSGRPPTLAGSETMIGLFINTLPVRVSVPGENLLLPWLQELQAQLVEARQYEYTPLIKIQSWSEIPPGASLFDSLVVFENYPIESALQTQVQDLQIRDIRASEKTNFPLTVMAFPGANLTLKILYDTQRFDSAAIARMLCHLQTLLESMAANPAQPLATLPLLTAAEQQQLATWNATETSYPSDRCIHQLFEQRVEQTPDAIALIGSQGQLTYQDLNHQANQLAHYLQTLGVGVETRVGVRLERSPEAVVALLAILKAGGAYVPLDPAYPSERLAWMLQDAQVSVLVTRSHLLNMLLPHNAKVVYLDQVKADIAQQPTQNLTVEVTPENLAYLLYTSGSTGQPKGVMGLHRNTVNRLLWNPYPFETNEVCCQKTSLNFVDSVWEIFAPLVHGIRSVILSDEIVKDADQLIQALATHQVTRLVLVPSLLRLLLDTFADLGDRLPKLRYWVSSGEALSADLCQRFYQQLPQAILLNLYGSSEVAADVTWHDTHQSSTQNYVPIGRPIANTQIYLLNQQLQPVPLGVTGEIYVGGAALARGYWNQPDLTRDRFIVHPQTGDRLYRTGDLGCFLPNGEIKFLGRADNQIKLRGIRIETGDIEFWLNQYPAVRTSVVVLREDMPGDQRLVAYVVPESLRDACSLAEELRQFASQQLPAYMVPSAYVYLPALPLSPNGKIDRRSLPLPESSNLTSHSSSEPETPIEAELAELWTAVLGIEKIGMQDDFFHLGGHSLLAMQLVSRIRKQFDLELTLAEFFATATVRKLAQKIEDAVLAKASDTELDELLDQLEGVGSSHGAGAQPTATKS